MLTLNVHAATLTSHNAVKATCTEVKTHKLLLVNVKTCTHHVTWALLQDGLLRCSLE